LHFLKVSARSHVAKIELQQFCVAHNKLPLSIPGYMIVTKCLTMKTKKRQRGWKTQKNARFVYRDREVFCKRHI